MLSTKLQSELTLLKPTTLVTRVEKFHFIRILPLPTPVQCWSNASLHLTIFQHWKGEWGAGNYSIGITVMSSCICHFPTHFAHGCSIAVMELLTVISYPVHFFCFTVLQITMQKAICARYEIWKFSNSTCQKPNMQFFENFVNRKLHSHPYNYLH